VLSFVRDPQAFFNYLPVTRTRVFSYLFRALTIFIAMFLAGCAANQLPGYQNTYYSYNVPQPLLDRIVRSFRENNLPNASVVRDSVGRVQLKGSYQNEEEVDRAFLIVQSTVGLKSTSPFYPDDIRVKRWEIDAAAALNSQANAVKPRPVARKHALVIGINDFSDSSISSIFGEDDGRIVSARARREGYQVVELLGSQATKLNIEQAVHRMKADIAPNDSLFIYISSHGTQPVPMPSGGDDRKMSIMAYDTMATGPDKAAKEISIYKNSVSDALIQDLARTPTRNTRVLIDTCYSGDMLRGIPDDSSRYIDASNNGRVERASIALGPWQPNYVSKGIRFAPAVAGARPSTASKPIDLTVFTLITATSNDEKSWGPGNGKFNSPVSPNRELKGSFFTQAFFEYLDLHRGQMEPAFKAARNFTQDKAKVIAATQNQPITQVPRMEPPLPPSDKRTLYE
jgi:hypothetical protein